ncbi:hypothetical protein FACS189499_10410 [Clostridia bacterium]|nr:hypothetical protein FACS189499_10410 [Clostridia bacterium]
MYNTNSIYNLKFISKDGKYEGVFHPTDLNNIENPATWILLMEENDPANMGTYNYGKSNGFIISNVTAFDNFLLHLANSKATSNRNYYNIRMGN